MPGMVRHMGGIPRHWSNTMNYMDFLKDYEKLLLALFFKRLTFEDVYQYTDPGTKEEQKAMAYDILAAIEKVQKELADQGFAPR